MTTVFYLVRHAAHDNLGNFLAGRSEGIRLGRAGRAQAARLARRLRRVQFGSVFSSPRERTRQTAAAIAKESDTGTIEICKELDEINFGSWSGKSFDELNSDRRWRLWNEYRGRASTPAGETMHDVEQRVIACMRKIDGNSDSHSVVLVSHADVIKAAVAYVLRLPPDEIFRFDIAPASISTIAMGGGGATLHGLNEKVD